MKDKSYKLYGSHLWVCRTLRLGEDPVLGGVRRDLLLHDMSIGKVSFLRILVAPSQSGQDVLW